MQLSDKADRLNHLLPSRETREREVVGGTLLQGSQPCVTVIVLVTV